MKTEKHYQKRRERLMPGNVPKYVRIYDNEGRSADNFTVVYTGKYHNNDLERYTVTGMNSAPYHPQGICMHDATHMFLCDTLDDFGWPAKRPPKVGGKCRLGTRIRFEDLPFDCQCVVLQDYICIWRLIPGDEPPSRDYIQVMLRSHT